MSDVKMIPLPDGAHALLRHPSKITERQRRPLVDARNRLGAAIPDFPPGMPEDEQKTIVGRAMMAEPALMNDVTDHLILALVVEWSFEAAVTRDGLLDIPGVAYDALKEECEKYREMIFPSFEPNEKRDSPTGPSSGSEGQ